MSVRVRVCAAKSGILALVHLLQPRAPTHPPRMAYAPGPLELVEVLGIQEG